MGELLIPELVNNYLVFCNYRERATQTKIVDLHRCDWLYPTTLLPLGIFIKKHKPMKYLPPTIKMLQTMLISSLEGLRLKILKANHIFLVFVFLKNEQKQQK